MTSDSEPLDVAGPFQRRFESALAPTRQMLVCASNGQFRSYVDPAEIDELLDKKETFIWLDLQNPPESGIELLRKEFKFHRLAIEDAVRRHERPKLVAYDNYYFMVVYALSYDTRLSGQAISLFIGANYIVSVHYSTITTIDETIQRWQANLAEFGQDSGALLYTLLDAIVDDYFPVIDELAERVEVIEEQIFARFSEDALQEVFRLKRDLLAVRRVVAPERDVLNVLIRREVPIFERNSILYLQDVYDHIVRITDSIDTYRDLLSGALDAFLSVQSNRLNQILKVLTIASIVLMTDALIAGVYGMNFDYMPILHSPYGFAISIALMVAVSAGLVLFFRIRRWL